MKNLTRATAQFFLRQSLAPFETMLSFFFVYAAIASMLSFGVAVTPLSQVLGPKIALAFNLTFLVAGLSVFFGIGLRRGNLEAVGLILVSTSLAVRTVASAWLFGFSPMLINGIVLNSAFVLSCMIRLTNILRAQRVLVNGE